MSMCTGVPIKVDSECRITHLIHSNWLTGKRETPNGFIRSWVFIHCCKGCHRLHSPEKPRGDEGWDTTSVTSPSTSLAVVIETMMRKRTWRNEPRVTTNQQFYPDEYKNVRTSYGRQISAYLNTCGRFSEQYVRQRSPPPSPPMLFISPVLFQRLVTQIRLELF